jgi:hypothetical protein
MNIETRGGPEMGIPKDPHEIHPVPHAWEPMEETGLQTPEKEVPDERENPLHNPLINPIPGDDETEEKKSPTLH